MTFQKYHRVSVFFLLCSSNCIISSNCLWVHCFFCLINCALAAFVWKLSVHFILKIQNLSCSLKKKKQPQNSSFDVSFCPCIISQILFICLSVLSYSSLNLQWLIFLSGSLYISILGCLPQRFILFLWWYLVSLILCVPWVLALLSLHLKKSPSPPVLTSWPWETKKLAQLEFRASLRPFLWVCLLHSSHSLTVGKIRIVCFLSVLQSQYECGKPPIYFPQGSALKCSKLRTFSELGGSSQLLTSMCTKLLGIHVHHLPESVGCVERLSCVSSGEASYWQEPVSQFLGCWLLCSTHYCCKLPSLFPIPQCLQGLPW